MRTATDTLQTIAATVAERVDRTQARSRADLELSLLVLEDVADELDGYPSGSTRDRFGQPADEPTVVLLRRLANAHHRLGVADRRGELTDYATERIVALDDALTGAGVDVADADRQAELVLACC